MHLIAAFLCSPFFEPRKQLGAIALGTMFTESYKIIDVQKKSPRQIFTHPESSHGHYVHRSLNIDELIPRAFLTPHPSKKLVFSDVRPKLPHDRITRGDLDIGCGNTDDITLRLTCGQAGALRLLQACAAKLSATAFPSSLLLQFSALVAQRRSRTVERKLRFCVILI